MDNITHSLVGVLAGDAVAQLRRKPRLPLWIASAVANSLPDVDVPWLALQKASRLEHLIHHRGHTHTLLLAPLQGLAFFALLLLVFRKRRGLPWKELAAVCLLGPVLHLLADSWNSYGVHPYWPIDNRWRYGDLIFIVEPWLWAVLLPFVWSRAESRAGRALALLLAALLLALAWRHSLVPMPVALGLSLFLPAWLLAQRLIADAGRRLALCLLLLAGAFAAFGAARHSLISRFGSHGSEQAYLAQPGNPFCWIVLTAGRRGSEYVAGSWRASAWPALLPVSRCPEAFGSGGSAPMAQPREPVAVPGALPLGEFRGAWSDLEEIAADCAGHGFLRFARIPFWKKEDGSFLLGDLRFDRIGRKSFAEIRTGETPCPSTDAPWIGRFLPPPSG